MSIPPKARPMQRQLNISYYDFTVSPPFFAGHPLTEGEAAALNNLWVIGIRNRVSHWIKALEPKLSSGAPWYGFLSPQQLSELQDLINKASESHILEPRPTATFRSPLQIELGVLQTFNNIKDPNHLQSEARRRLRARLDATHV